MPPTRLLRALENVPLLPDLETTFSLPDDQIGLVLGKGMGIWGHIVAPRTLAFVGTLRVNASDHHIDLS
jgi:hypothetical protein